ncbi:Fur family transcriptional regulator [Paenibacillus tarimensis]
MEESSAKRMIDTMIRYGLRMTEQRRTIVRLFTEAPGFLSAKEVYLEMVATYKGLSFDTVYRNLNVLEKLGVLELFRFEDGNKFKASCSNHSHHHHHFICLACNGVYPLDYCPMRHLKAPDHFKVTKHIFEIYGYCGSCRNNKTDQSRHTLPA